MDNSGISTNNQNLNIEYDEVTNNEVTNNINNINGNTNQLKNLNVLVNGTYSLPSSRRCFSRYLAVLMSKLSFGAILDTGYFL